MLFHIFLLHYVYVLYNKSDKLRNSFSQIFCLLGLTEYLVLMIIMIYQTDLELMPIC